MKITLTITDTRHERDVYGRKQDPQTVTVIEIPEVEMRSTLIGNLLRAVAHEVAPRPRDEPLADWERELLETTR